MKKLLVLILGISIQTAIAASDDLPDYGWYAGFSAASAFDDGEGKAQLKGASGGLAFGYRWRAWSLEANYNYINIKSPGGVANAGFGVQAQIEKAQLKGHSYGLALKGIFLRYLMFGIGFGVFKASHDFDMYEVGNPSNRIILKDDGTYSEGFAQLGIVLPLYRHLDLRVFYESRSYSSSDIEYGSSTLQARGLDFSLTQYVAQAIYYFN